VALPAFAAECRAAAQLLLTAGPLTVQQLINISWPPGPHQRPDGQTDGRTNDSCIDPAPQRRWQCQQCTFTKQISLQQNATD